MSTLQTYEDDNLSEPIFQKKKGSLNVYNPIGFHDLLGGWLYIKLENQFN
jgi:hypothetical protein